MVGVGRRGAGAGPLRRGAGADPGRTGCRWIPGGAEGPVGDRTGAAWVAGRDRRLVDGGRRGRSTRWAIPSPGSATRAASRRPTCCACAPARRTTPPTSLCCRARTTRCWPCCRCARRARIAVVPFGGGTSVVGGLTPDRSSFGGVVALDLRRLNALLALDEVSRVAVLEPGLRGPEAEALLGERGYTIGHFPQSFDYATLGGFAATRSSGQASAGYGRFDDLVVELRVATPAGTLEFGRAPKSAAGPDLRQLILGSEGAFGVITRLGVQVRPAPAVRVYEGWRFPTFAEGCGALRRLVQDGPMPTVLRLSDEAETALSRRVCGECRIGTGRRMSGDRRLRGHGGVSRYPPVGGWAGAARRRGFTGSRGRGQLGAEIASAGRTCATRMLAAGALVETLETATFWSGLDRLLRGRVERAARRAGWPRGPRRSCCATSRTCIRPARRCTSLSPAPSRPIRSRSGAPPRPPPATRSSPPAARSPTITASGATTGRGMSRRSGHSAVDVVRAVKATLDPVGIMNPGILVGGSGPS